MPRTGRPWLERAGDIAFLLLLPVVAFWLMHFHPIAQNGYLDPYIYTGYVNNFDDLIQRYGATYYGVRFGYILPGKFLVSSFGALPGYFLFRYCLVLAGSVPFYVLLKQRYGRSLAMGVVAVLVTSPYLARTVLWDSPDASAVPFLLGSVSLLHVEHHRRRLRDLGAGILAGLAIHSNFFVIAPLGAFIGTYAVVWLISGRGLRALGQQFAWFAAGPVIVTAAGSLYYWWAVNVRDIWTVTFRIIVFLIDGGTEQWRSPDAAWVTRKWAVLTPLCLSMMALFAYIGGRRSLQAIALGTGAACAAGLLYVHQFLLNGNTLELFYYFSFALPSTFLLLALVVAGIWEHSSSRVQLVSAWALVLCAVVPWIMYSLEFPATLTTFEHHLVMTAVAGTLIVLTRVLPSWRTTFPVLASAALGLTFFSSFAQAQYAGMVNSRLHPQHVEEDVYRVALQFIRTIPTWADRPGRIRFWYSTEPAGNSMNSIQSTFLWGYSKVHGEIEGLPHLGPEELQIIRSRNSKWLALLAERHGDLALAREALVANDVRFRTMTQRRLTSGGYTLHVELLELHPVE